MRRVRKRRGNILVLSVFLLAVAVTLFAFAVDLGYIFTARSELQVAADAAALAGADELSKNPSNAATVAEQIAELNLVSGDAVDIRPNEDIELGKWNTGTGNFEVLTGSAIANANAMRVTTRLTEDRDNALPLIFARVFGRNLSEPSASSVARIKTAECGKVLAKTAVMMSGTSYIDSYHSDVGPYSSSTAGEEANVCCNGFISMSGFTEIKGNAHPGPGFSVTAGANVTGSTAPLESPLTFLDIVLGDVATNNDNGSIPLTSLGRNPLTPLNQLMLLPGETLDLPTGTYYFTMLNLGSGSTLNTDPSTAIYVTGMAMMPAGNVVNSSGFPGDLQLFCTGTMVSLSGTTDFHGIVYAPNAMVTRSGTSDYYGMIVGNFVMLSGSGGIHVDKSIGPLYGVRNGAVLVD